MAWEQNKKTKELKRTYREWTERKSAVVSAISNYIFWLSMRLKGMSEWCLHCVHHRPLYHQRLCISPKLFSLSHYGYEAAHYVFKPMLVVPQDCLWGPDLTPLTRHTFLQLSWNGPPCFGVTVAGQSEQHFLHLTCSGNLQSHLVRKFYFIRWRTQS